MRRPPPLGEKAATGCSSGCSSPPPTSRQPTCARGARGLVMQLLAGVFRLVCVCTIVCTRVRKMGRRVHCAAAACVAARAAMDARARRAERKSSGTVVGTPSRWKWPIRVCSRSRVVGDFLITSRGSEYEYCFQAPDSPPPALPAFHPRAPHLPSFSRHAASPRPPTPHSCESCRHWHTRGRPRRPARSLLEHKKPEMTGSPRTTRPLGMQYRAARRGPVRAILLPSAPLAR